MKAKLILKRHNDCYSLNDYREPSKGYPLVIAHSGDENFRYKLSKQNCDEIFGVVDVEKLAEECAETAHTMDELYENGLFYGFISGFNKAMELNKDKVFTLEDMGNIWDFCTYNKGTFAEFIQQLTEIEVEIEMEWITAKTFCDTCNKVMYPDYRCEDKTCFSWQPKLDSERCLILKKI